MDAGKPETKLRENMRYLGYTIGIFAGTIALALFVLFLGEIIAFLLGVIRLVAFIVMAASLVLAGIYLAVYRKKENR